MGWPVRYSDHNGIEESQIFSDGKNLKLMLRGINFSGTDFDSLSPEKEANIAMLKSFSLHESCLCDCKLECVIKLPVQVRGNIIEGDLLILLELGSPTHRGMLDKEDLRLTLQYDTERLISSGASGWFEDELLEIQKLLPNDVFMKACINCAYSDYSPYGHGLFGWMMCFRNLKQEYLQVKSKDDFFRIQEQFDRLVQETYLCNEFERRKMQTGYRG